MEKSSLKFDQRIYILKDVKNFAEIREKAIKFIYTDNILEKKSVKSEREKIIINLDGIKFVVCPVKTENRREEVKIIKTENIIDYGKIKIDKQIQQFKTDLCFIVSYFSDKRFNFIFEELIEHIIERKDIYSKL